MKEKLQQTYAQFTELSKNGLSSRLDVIQKQLLREFVLGSAFDRCSSDGTQTCVMRIGKDLYHALGSIHTFAHGYRSSGLSKHLFQNGGYRMSSNVNTKDSLLDGYYPQNQKLYVRFVCDDSLECYDFTVDKEDFCMLGNALDGCVGKAA